jgi:NodT family efflux transporter outer membrane factor (OMF) lipoprotein
MQRPFRPSPSNALLYPGAPAACYRRTALALVAVASLAGCALHKVNPAPRPAVGEFSPEEKYSIFNDARYGGVSWWSGFNAPALDQLAIRALEGNFDIAAAGERLNQALALQRRAGGALWPQLELSGSYDRDVAARGRSERDDAWEAGAGLAWEIDFFKRLGSTRLARRADATARRHLLEAVRLAVSVSVAEAYYGIVEQRQLLSLLAKQRDTSAELLRIIERRYEQGLTSRLDVLQQQSQLAEVESQIPTAESLLDELKNQLGALLGGLPAGDRFLSAGETAVFPTLPDLAGIAAPDELLRLRPDLRAARADLVAADAETARALAERLPRVSFSAEALLLRGRGPDGSLITLGGDIVQPLLNWGQRRSEWLRTKAVYRERLAIFSQAYVRAVWSLDTLVRSEAKQRELLDRLHQRKQLLDATLGLATSRYTSGLTDYLPVLSATQQLYALEQRLIREQRRLTSLRIALHQALGGPLPAAAGAGDDRLTAR